MDFIKHPELDDIIFGSTKKEPCDEFEKLIKDKFQMSSMGELTFFLGLQVQQRKKGIFISQDKYVHEILRKFNYTGVKSASTPTDLEKPLVKDGDADDVDEHLYRSLIGSLMYLTTSRPDIMFAVCACARFQVSLKNSQLLIIKELLDTQSKPSLGLWYSKDSPLELVAYTDSDYAGATLDRKSTTGGCQFLGNRLISWQCKKQTVVATSTTEAEYVAAASCCGQSLDPKQVAYMGFHQIIDFITRSHICYALTKKPEVCVSFIKQFWRSAEILTDDNGTVKIHATIDGHSLSITEGSLWRHLKLDDQDGITSLPTTEIFAQLALMGYATDSDKLTFQKGAFSPQWRDTSVKTHNSIFSSHPNPEVFSNMKRITKGFSGQEVALFPNMLAVPTPSASPSNSISSPEPTPTQPSPQPSPTQPSPTQPSPTQPGSEYHPPTPHDSPLHAVHSHGSDEGSLKLQELMNLINTLSDRIGVLEADLTKTKKTYSSAYTKLILRVKKLEAQLKVGKARRHSRFVLSDTEVGEDDSSKQGRKFSNEGVQDDEGVHEKASNDTEIFVQEVTPTELIQDQEASGKASDEVSTAGLKKGPVSEEVPTVSTAEATLSTAGGTVTYSRRSAEKRSRKDKGKAILIEEEPKKKSKKDLEQEQLSYAEAIRLEEQMHEEQRAQIARDAEIARQWDDKKENELCDAAKESKARKAKSLPEKRKGTEVLLKKKGSTEKIVEERPVTQENRKS
ncbi:putative ribonuclease H-like domain-containing protein [Tanacetum coccineum]